MGFAVKFAVNSLHCKQRVGKKKHPRLCWLLGLNLGCLLNLRQESWKPLRAFFEVLFT